MITAWDDRTSTADTDQHDDSGLCRACGHWFPASEWKFWQNFPTDTAEGFDNGDQFIPLSSCCGDCRAEYHQPDGDNPQY